MKQITFEMMNMYKLRQLGFDFMGYTCTQPKQLSFHHLILSKEYCRKAKLGKGYWYWNGVILVQNTAHEYLHLIQRYDDELFRYLTSEMLDMKIKGYLDIYNLQNIQDILDYFEYQHIEDKTDKGHYIIKERYLERNRFK